MADLSCDDWSAAAGSDDETEFDLADAVKNFSVAETVEAVVGDGFVGPDSVRLGWTEGRCVAQHRFWMSPRGLCVGRRKARVTRAAE